MPPAVALHVCYASRLGPKVPVGVVARMDSTSTFIMKEALVEPHLGVEYLRNK